MQKGPQFEKNEMGSNFGTIVWMRKKRNVFERKITSENASHTTRIRKLPHNCVGELFHRGYGGIPSK